MKTSTSKTRWSAVGKRRFRRLAIESFEERRLLSAVQHPIDYTPLTEAVVDPTPAQMQGAYGVNNMKVGSVVGNGAGQTIALIDVGNENSISTQAAVYSDMQGFDATFGLPDPPSFQVLNENGGTTLPAYNSGWSGEEALDMEWAHAMAPMANIILYETSGSLYTAVSTAARNPAVSVISMSWGISPENTSEDSLFTTPVGHQGVTFLAATGDGGGESSYPANSPNVIAVGGTTLNTNGNVWSSESAWSGSGGGQDTNESEPTYQRGVQATGYRETPDVSTDANPGTGVSIYVNGALSQGYLTGGTSLATPLFAGVIAIADQLRVALGSTTLDGATQTLPMLYSLPAADFHDITSGSNNINSAGPGYDLVTGLGSPVANLLVPALAPFSELTTTMSDSGSFPLGGAGTFTIGASNTGAAATSGTVTIRDALPTGLTATAADSGTVNGWSLSVNGQIVTATRSDSLAAGASYPALTIAVNVASNAPVSMTNAATASGGGELNTAYSTATDTIGSFVLPQVTTIGPPSGAMSGGAIVVITGTNLLNVSAVDFGATPGTILLDTGNQILAKSPAGSAGSVDVTVVKQGASSLTSPADQFTYLTPPAVSAVSTLAAANSVFTVNDTVPITVAFTEPVYVTGTPQITLNDGGVAYYTGGSSASTLTFTYTVAAGQSSSDLDYSSTGALILNGGSIQDASNEAAALTLPATGTDGLAVNDIAISNAPLIVPASVWALPGLTIMLGGGNVNVDVTGTNSAVVAPQALMSVPSIEIAAPNSGSADLTIDSSAGNPIPSGGLNYSGAGGLIKTGSGSANLSGTSTFMGGTTVLSGTLIVVTASALPDASNLTVGANAAAIFASSVSASSVAAAIPMVESSKSAKIGSATTADSSGGLTSAVTAAPLSVPQSRSGFDASVVVIAKSRSALTAVASASLGSRTSKPNTSTSVNVARMQGRGPQAVDAVVARRHAGNSAWLAASLDSWSDNQGSTRDRLLHALDAGFANYGA